MVRAGASTSSNSAVSGSATTRSLLQECGAQLVDTRFQPVCSVGASRGGSLLLARGESAHELSDGLGGNREALRHDELHQRVGPTAWVLRCLPA